MTIDVDKVSAQIDEIAKKIKDGYYPEQLWAR